VAERGVHKFPKATLLPPHHPFSGEAPEPVLEVGAALGGLDPTCDAADLAALQRDMLEAVARPVIIRVLGGLQLDNQEKRDHMGTLQGAYRALHALRAGAAEVADEDSTCKQLRKEAEQALVLQQLVCSKTKETGCSPITHRCFAPWWRCGGTRGG
jgi:hypothetical protein